MAAHVAGSSTVYPTIQAAVNAAPSGGTVTVDAGTYAEQVTVSKPLTIRGAQAGVDGRGNGRLYGPASAESVVTGSVSGTTDYAAFYVNASDVTLDGFTVQGENSSDVSKGAGIVIAPNQHGTHVVDDIVQNNVAGLFLANNSSTDAALIQHDVFRYNNNAGSNGGRGIYTDQVISGGNLTNVTIDANAFVGNRGGGGTTGYEAAMAFQSANAGSQSNIRITNNVLDGNGKAALFFNTNNVTLTGNEVTGTLDQWSGTLRFEGGDTNVTIRNNTVYDNTGPALAVDSTGATGNDSGFAVTNNNFYGNSSAWGSHLGVIVNASNYTGTFDARNNWWGNASGPGGTGPGTGDTLYGNGQAVRGSQWTTLSGGNALYSPWSTAPNGSEETPYWGAPPSAVTTIQAEDYDQGGKNVAYSTSATSNGGGQYRPVESVGIEATTDAGAGYDVGWTNAGEWLNYTTNLPQGGTYTLAFRVSNGQSTSGAFHLNVDGQNVTGTLTAPPTGGWQNWQTLTVSGVSLGAGPHVLRLVMDSAGSAANVCNFNWFKFTLGATSSPPAAPANLVATAQGASSVGLTWQESSSGVSGFLVQRSTDGVTFAQVGTAAAGATSYTDTGLSAGKTYTYRVLATSASGNSPPSNTASATTPSSSTTTYVSDLSWVSATVGWGTIQKDASIKGNPITLRGTVYTKGIGTHANSTIVYNLAGKYASFLSDIGIDDEVNGQGTVDFQVLGDGNKVLYDSGTLTGASPVAHVNLGVAGVQQLSLVVNTTTPGNIDYDHGDWAGARLIT